jgi:hypothetical protein
MTDTQLNIAVNGGAITLTTLYNIHPLFSEFAAVLSKPLIAEVKNDTQSYVRTTGTKRNKAGVDKVAAVLLIDGDSSIDADGNVIKSATDMQLIHRLLCGLQINHVIHTSHSHNPSQGVTRWRVVIPATYVETELVTLLNWLFKEIHAENIPLVNAIENKDFARAWFFASCPADRVQDFRALSYFDGGALNVPWIMQNHVMPVTEVALPNNRVAITTPLKTYVVTEGQTCPMAAFNATYSVIEILLRNGYKPVSGSRFIHPNSTSGKSGTRILESGLAFSDSTHDLLNDGRGHDAFDCYRILECSGNSKIAKAWSTAITAANQAEWRVRNKKTRHSAGFIAQHNVIKSTSTENLQDSQSR